MVRGGPRWSGVQAPKESLRDPLILEYKSTSALRACALGTLRYRARGPGADPIAFGQPAPGLGMKGCLDVWFLWLVGWLADWLFGLLVGCKIHQVGGGKSVNLFQKPCSWIPKSSKIGRKRGLGKVLGVPSGLLEGSWGAFEPKRAP